VKEPESRRLQGTKPMADTRESRLASRLQQARSSYGMKSSAGTGAGTGAGAATGTGTGSAGKRDAAGGVPGGPSLASRSDEHGSRASRG